MKTTYLERFIYEMITENTGIHFLDSGFENGRNFQKNKEKTIDYFLKQDLERFYFDGQRFYRELSVFKYLTDGNLLFDSICEVFNNYNKNTKDWHGEIDGNDCIYGTSKIAADFLNDMDAYVIKTINTYNYDCDLSQVLQYSLLKIMDETYFLLQIHGGADVRGGYTDAKLFLCPDGIINNVWDYMSHYEILNEIKNSFIYDYDIKVYDCNGDVLKISLKDDDVIIIDTEDSIVEIDL